MILMALPQNRTLQQFKLSRTNKALGVISVGIAAKDAEAIEEILDRNVRAFQFPLCCVCVVCVVCRVCRVSCVRLS
jgi:hypothetical protein